jgi:LuxR family transcriptional regulator, maltose regulon positive regulatory protein
MVGPGVMSVSDVRERPGRAHRAGGPAFDLVVSKLRSPRPRSGTVWRPSLVERLARDDLRTPLLPLLCTHMTVPEIAAELFLSPHTIKSQMKSIYRKLEATNRHQAITRARELELIDR